jgi:hypothetical protein
MLMQQAYRTDQKDINLTFLVIIALSVLGVVPAEYTL